MKSMENPTQVAHLLISQATLPFTSITSDILAYPNLKGGDGKREKEGGREGREEGEGQYM